MFFDRFDRIILGAVGVLIVLLGMVVAVGDRVGVPVEAYTPASGSQPATTTPISITFGQAMDTATVEERFSIQPGLSGIFSWAGSTVTFTPSEPFEVGTRYTVTLEAGAQNTNGTEVLRDLTWSFEPRDPSILYLGPADVQVQSLWRISPEEDAEPTLIYRTDTGVADFTPSPDGNQIAVTIPDREGSGEIWLIDREGRSPRQITACAPGICNHPAWSPDGTQIAYERREVGLQGGLGPSRVWFYDFETEQHQMVFEDNQVLGFSPAWSPDGSKLAFFDSNQQVIRVLDISGGGGSFLIPTEMGEVGSFFPDGSAMIYADIRLVGSQFFTELMAADFGIGGELKPYLSDSEEDQWPAVSPDGRTLAFGRRLLDRSTGFGSQMMLYDIERDETTQITDDPAINNLLFQWDPTGRYVLFTRFDLEALYAQPQIWVYDTINEELRFIAEGASLAEWTP